MNARRKTFVSFATAGSLAILAAATAQAAALPATVYDSSNWRNASATVNGVESDGRGDTGGGAGTTVNGSYITYDLGAVKSINDASVTAWVGGTGAGWANNFVIQVSTSDNPANNDWVTVGTASNIYGSDANSNNFQQNLARRLYFPEQTKQYFRFVNQNPTGPYSLWLAELAVQRPVVVVDQFYPDSKWTGDINNTTDGKFSTSSTVIGTMSGSVTLDVYKESGQGVSGLTLTSANGDFQTYNLPKNVHVYYSPTDDMNNLTTLLKSDTLSIPLDKNSNNSATINFGQSVDARYFKLVWDDIQLPNNGANTVIAEISPNYAPVPEPGTLGLLGGAALLMLRRRKRA